MFRLPLVLLFFSVAIAPASQLVDNLRKGTPQTVVAYGTSLTAQPAAGQWVNDLRSWLNSQYPGLATVINSGMSGKASNTAVQNLQSKVLNYDPDTVIIEFSMNDAFTNFSASNNPTDWNPQITTARAKSNLESMITSIQTQNPFAEIVLMTMNPVYDGPPTFTGATYRPDLASYYQVYRDVASERGLLLVDNYVNWESIYNGNMNLFRAYVPDGVHPTSAASSAIIFPAVKDVLISVPQPSMIGLVAVGVLCVFLAMRCRVRGTQRGNGVIENP
jgi:lysophospholipase L1-like esterase